MYGVEHNEKNQTCTKTIAIQRPMEDIRSGGFPGSYVRTGRKPMKQHIKRAKLFEVAVKQLPLPPAEFHHIQKCRKCTDSYSEIIQKVARTREKERKKSQSAGQ
jgi:hypothetical protein